MSEGDETRLVSVSRSKGGNLKNEGLLAALSIRKRESEMGGRTSRLLDVHWVRCPVLSQRMEMIRWM